MGSRIIRNKDADTERVYKAAERWVECALLSDDSLFTPGTAIWSSCWLGELRQKLQDQPGNFLNNLQRQLAGRPPEVYQLVSEALYFYYLIDASTKGTTKQNNIAKVISWSEEPVEIPQGLIDSLSPGLVDSGTTKPFQKFHVGFLIEVVEHWKEKEKEEQNRLLNDPWAFKDFVTQLGFRSELLKGAGNEPRAQREGLLHLVFPDTFEAIVSHSDKESIANSFANLVKDPSGDVDRQLAQIRPALEAQYGNADHLFYVIPEIRVQWDKNYKPGNEDIPTEVTSPWIASKIAKLADQLLWPPEPLQEIIDDLQEKRQVIFYGPPGTGKTYVAQAIAQHCQENGGGFEIVQFHPSYSYEDFVEGFRPTLTDDGQAGFKLTQGPLRRIAKKAEANPDATFILIIDELNRGNVSKVLGELYFLLEYRGRAVRLQYGGGDGEDGAESEGFSLPSNLWFICTMNTADRSIALMDAALRRRFYFAPFFPNKSPIKGLLRRWLDQHGHDALAADLVDAANAKLDRDSGIGPSHFMVEVQTLDENRVRRIWNRAVIPYVEEQCFGDADKLAKFKFERLKGQLPGSTPLDAALEPVEGIDLPQADADDTDA